jgi:superfamily II DNA/RNA helicase
MNFCEPSSIQKKAILPLLNLKDIIAQGQSGTGKTCCFALACCQLVDETLYEPQALVMTPTRELALQNRDVIKLMGENLGTKVDCLIGGNPVEEDVKRLQDGSQIIVGTPGKI